MSTPENRTLTQIWAFIALLIILGAALWASILLEPSADPMDIEPPMLLEVCTEYAEDGRCFITQLERNPAWEQWFAYKLSGGQTTDPAAVDWSEK